ncbi:MAG: glycerophosphoryl diester phosphodiesterase [Streptosporangiaceae bacterium]|jgi:glycerophosphoryl diester phosphodiesterase|nr:glycerophosphodiester phosphodiesterase [Streptosporangiaceae bacterium]MDX6434743.1 glycerophosphoryl diester phosphodiesterase [Streptosporangiaceae bacterium]
MLRWLAPYAVTAMTLAAVAVPGSPSVTVPGSPSVPAVRVTARQTVRPPAPVLRVFDIAHRGASAYAPENTLASFREAARRHANLFELDVRRTKDGRLIIMHDATLDRTTDAKRVFRHRAPWRISDFTLAEIRRLDAGSWKGRRFRGERVPTLGQTLRAMEGSGLGLLLEVKTPARNPGIGERVAAELRADRSWLRPGRLIVQSYDWDFARRFHRLLPQVAVGLLGTARAGQLRGLGEYAGYLNSPYQKVTTSYVARAHRLHLKVFAWTVDDPAVMRRMIATGVDGIITDRPGTIPATH